MSESTGSVEPQQDESAAEVIGDSAAAVDMDDASVPADGPENASEPAAEAVSDDGRQDAQVSMTSAATGDDQQDGQLANMNEMDGGFDLRDFVDAGAGTAAGKAGNGGHLERILRIEVPVIVKVAEKQLPLGEVINLSPGSIIEFSRSSDQPLELQVNNKIIGTGAAVKVGEKFGLRITRIAPVAEKIRSLGGQ